MITARADVVGSLLRPSWLLEARASLVAGTITGAEFKRIEDRAVDEAVALQEAVGLPVVTDGEMRRQSFQSPLIEAVDGFGTWDLDAFLWGHWRGDDDLGDWIVPRPPSLGVVEKLRPRRHLCAEEATYLRARTRRIAKVTLPSPSLWANVWSPERSASAYATFDAFLADVVDILRDEVTELARLGVRYIQIDAPHYPLLVSPEFRAFYEGRGWTVAHWLARGIEMDNAVMAAAPEVTFGFHL